MESVNFELTDDEILKLENEFNSIIKKCDELEKIDTEGVKPAFSVLEDININKFNDDKVINSSDEFKNKIFDKNKMVDGFYQVPNKEGN